MTFTCILCLDCMFPNYLTRLYNRDEFPIYIKCKECACNMRFRLASNGDMILRKVKLGGLEEEYPSCIYRERREHK
jgi:hypothetical protein